MLWERGTAECCNLCYSSTKSRPRTTQGSESNENYWVCTSWSSKFALSDAWLRKLESNQQRAMTRAEISTPWGNCWVFCDPCTGAQPWNAGGTACSIWCAGHSHLPWASAFLGVVCKSFVWEAEPWWILIVWALLSKQDLLFCLTADIFLLLVSEFCQCGRSKENENYLLILLVLLVLRICATCDPTCVLNRRNRFLRWLLK